MSDHIRSYERAELGRPGGVGCQPQGSAHGVMGPPVIFRAALSRRRGGSGLGWLCLPVIRDLGRKLSLITRVWGSLGPSQAASSFPGDGTTSGHGGCGAVSGAADREIRRTGWAVCVAGGRGRDAAAVPQSGRPGLAGVVAGGLTDDYWLARLGVAQAGGRLAFGYIVVHPRC